jgi:hypothetical protein
MDTWVKIGVVAAVMQTAIAMLVLFDIAPSSFDTLWMWRFLFVSVTLFTWAVLYWIVQRQKNIQQAVPVRGQGNLIIHSAVYGLGSGQDRDVTKRVCALVMNGRLNIEVRPETFLIDDPYPNRTKSLRVTCSYGDKEKVRVERTDYQFLNLPLEIENEI